MRVWCFGWGIEFGHAFDMHVAVLELPLVILLEEDSPDEANDAVLIGEDADDRRGA